MEGVDTETKMSSPQRPEGGLWSGTLKAKERLATNPLYEEPYGGERTGKYAGRRIIGRDVPINGGVYLGGNAREAIVVDDSAHPTELNETYDKLLKRIYRPEPLRQRLFPKVFPTRAVNLFEEVFAITKEAFGGEQTPEIHRKAEERAEQEVAQKGPDSKIALNVFIHEKAGVCRHRALLAGYLIERLIRERRTQGKVSVDRSYVPGQGGHAWVRYEGVNGLVTIIDPAMGYVGSLDQAPPTWNYRRPGEV